LARGLDNKELRVPRLGDSLTSIETSTSTFDVVRSVLTFSKQGNLSYRIRRYVSLKRWSQEGYDSVRQHRNPRRV